jgi:hypothetical protein
VADELSALRLVRSGTKINFDGARSICDFDSRGDQLNRHYAQSVLVQTLKGPETPM